MTHANVAKLAPVILAAMLPLMQYGGCTIDDGAFGYLTPSALTGFTPNSSGGSAQPYYYEEYYEEEEVIYYTPDWYSPFGWW